MLPVRAKNEAVSARSAAGIAKIAAAGSGVINNPMIFDIGDRVVHPQHGVGMVINVGEREFGSGERRRYYEVAIPNSGSILWVPVDAPAVGLRQPATRSEINNCRKVLASPPAPLADDVRTRQANLMERLRRGPIRVQCEVVRDLYAFGEHKSLYGTMAGFFRQTQNVLCEEWAFVENVTLAEAAQEISSLLEKSRRMVKKPKP
jgi:CarD family transcriptional regulator